MLDRPVFAVHVHRQNGAVPEQIEEMRHVQRAATGERTDLDDEVRPRGEEDLLVEPGVERVLVDRDTHPGRRRQDLALDVLHPFPEWPVQKASAAVSFTACRHVRLSSPNPPLLGIRRTPGTRSSRRPNCRGDWCRRGSEYGETRRAAR